MSVATLIRAVDDLRDTVTRENYQELRPQFSELVAREWANRVSLAPDSYLPLPVLLPRVAPPWFGVHWVIGAPHPFDVLDTVDRRLVCTVNAVLAYSPESGHRPVLISNDLAFDEFEDAEAFSRALTLGLKATPHMTTAREGTTGG